MKNSLKSKLNELIKIRGEISYSELCAMLERGSFGRYYKRSCLERRLRKSESPNIESVIENGYVKSYRWVGEPIKFKECIIKGFDGQPEGTIRLPV